MRKLFKIGFVVLFLIIIFLLALNYYYGCTHYWGEAAYIKNIDIHHSLSELSPDRCDNKNFREAEFLDDCYAEVAYQFLDINFCDKIINVVDKEDCITFVNRGKDLDACLSFYTRLNEGYPEAKKDAAARCYGNHAFYTNNPDLCEQAPDKDVCYAWLAPKMWPTSKKDFNLEICDRITGSGKWAEFKAGCYLIGSIIKDDPGLCTKISKTNKIEQSQIQVRDACFYYFAQKESKSEICDGIDVGNLRRHCKLIVLRNTILKRIKD